MPGALTEASPLAHWRNASSNWTRSLVALVPFGRGSSLLIDVAAARSAITDAGGNRVWTAGPLGLGMDYSAETGANLRFNQRTDCAILGDVPFTTMLALFDRATTSGTSFRPLIHYGSSINDGFWALGTRGPDVRFAFRVAGAQQNIDFTNAHTANNRDAIYVLTRGVGGSYRLWVNGEFFGPVVNATTPDTSPAPSSNELRHGTLTNANLVALGVRYIGAVWQRELEDGEALALARDPFLLLRQPLLVTSSVAAGNLLFDETFEAVGFDESWTEFP